MGRLSWRSLPAVAPLDSATGEVVTLLSALIRNRCVNDGSPESGHEWRSAQLLRDHLALPDVELRAPAGRSERQSLVARLPGTDPSAPTLVLVGHTDVVPVTPDGWTRDPFGGELVDGEVWGRGAVDMLNQTAAMAVAFRRLARRPRRLRGTLVYVAVADEEGGGGLGARYLLDHHPDLVRGDVVLTEAGGTVTDTSSGPVLSAMVGEKGMAPTTIVVRGRSGHASVPLITGNALQTAAEAVNRIAAHRPPTRILPVWRQWVEATVEDPELRDLLLDEDRLADHLHEVPLEHRATAHACTHDTYTPTQIAGAPKRNVVPDEVTIGLDIRLLPGEGPDDVERHLGQLLAGLDVEISLDTFVAASSSPQTEPVWASLERAARAAYPEGRLVPSLFTGGTDGRHFRAKGIPAFGFGVLSRAMPPARYWSLFHGADERIDVESLRLSTEAWTAVAEDYLR